MNILSSSVCSLLILAAPTVAQRPPPGPGPEGPRPPPPQPDFCGQVPLLNYTGITTLIDVDGSGAFVPTIGDMSISESIKPTETFGDSDVTIKAVCIITNPDPSAGAPMCTFDTSVKVPGGPPPAAGGTGFLEGTTMAVGTPPNLKLSGGSGDFFGAYGTIETGQDLVVTPNDDGTSSLTFTALVNFCIPAPVAEPPSCEDDPAWTYTLRDGREEDCAWVAFNPRRRCGLVGSTGSAKDQCSSTCDSECGAPDFS